MLGAGTDGFRDGRARGGLGLHTFGRRACEAEKARPDSAAGALLSWDRQKNEENNQTQTIYPPSHTCMPCAPLLQLSIGRRFPLGLPRRTLSQMPSHGFCVGSALPATMTGRVSPVGGCRGLARSLVYTVRLCETGRTGTFCFSLILVVIFCRTLPFYYAYRTFELFLLALVA